MSNKIQEKRANYISRLTYILYKLNGSDNASMIMSAEDAKKLPSDIAEDMIKELRKSIWNKEMNNYIYPHIFELDCLVKIPYIVIPSYEKIDRVKPVGSAIYIYTIEGKEYVVDTTKKVLLGKATTTLKNLYDSLVKAINFDLGVRVYTDTNISVITVEDQARDEIINRNVSLVNDVLSIMDNHMILSFKKVFAPEHISIIQKYLDDRDREVSERFKITMSNKAEANNFCTILNSLKEHYYGLTGSYNKV